MPHSGLNEIKLIQITNNVHTDLIYNNLSSLLFTNKRYRETLLKSASILIDKPNEGIIQPVEKPEIASPKRARVYKPTTKYTALKTVDTKWSQQQLIQFINLRFKS